MLVFSLCQNLRDFRFNLIRLYLLMRRLDVNKLGETMTMNMKIKMVNMKGIRISKTRKQGR